MTRYSAHGFDFTDEGFYLNWISTPFAWDWLVSYFGFVWHPLYTAFAGDVHLLRVTNIGVTFGLAYWLALSLLALDPPTSATSRLGRHVIASASATVAFALFDGWLITPNYNTLAVQGLTLAAVALILIEKFEGLSRRCSNAYMLLGFAGALVFLAKPSSAAALAPTALTYLWLSGKWNSRGVLLSIAVASGILAIAPYLFGVSIIEFYAKLSEGLRLATLLEGGHGLIPALRIDHIALTSSQFLIAAAVITICSLAVFLQLTGSKLLSDLSLIICCIMSTICLLLAGGWLDAASFQGFHRRALMLAIPATSVVILILGRSVRNSTTPVVINWSDLSLLSFLPWVAAFGSNNNYWWSAGAASFFWVFAALILLRPVVRLTSNWNLVTPVILAAQLITAALLNQTLSLPYRQPSITAGLSEEVVLAGKGGPLFLSPVSADYLQEAHDKAIRSGFLSGTPLIDLSGRSPGLLYHLGAASVAQPWFIGGYKGSYRLAVATLALEPCDRVAQSWVLLEPEGPRRIDFSVLTSVGVKFSDYSVVAAWQTQPYVGGYYRRYTQVLLKPHNHVGVENSCKLTRAEAGN